MSVIDFRTKEQNCQGVQSDDWLRNSSKIESPGGGGEVKGQIPLAEADSDVTNMDVTY